MIFRDPSSLAPQNGIFYLVECIFTVFCTIENKKNSAFFPCEKFEKMCYNYYKSKISVQKEV